MISGDLITADDESPLVNTLYCDMRLAHLKSTWIKIRHAFKQDDKNRLPEAVALELTEETRRFLHSRRINELGNRL